VSIFRFPGLKSQQQENIMEPAKESYYQKNKAARLAYQHQYYLDNINAQKDYFRRYYLANSIRTPRTFKPKPPKEPKPKKETTPPPETNNEPKIRIEYRNVFVRFD